MIFRRSRIAFTLAAAMAAAGCAGPDTAGKLITQLSKLDAGGVVALTPPDTSCKPNDTACAPIRFSNVSGSFKQVMPEVAEVMIRLDPRYKDYLRHSDIRFYSNQSESSIPGALAFYDTEKKYTAVNDYPEAHQKHNDKLGYYLSVLGEQIPEAIRPDIGMLKGLMLMAALANEFAHYKSEQAGYSTIMPTLKAKDTNRFCAAYARVQHVSDLMSLDIMERVLRHAVKTNDQKLRIAARLVTQVALWPEATPWLDAVEANEPTISALASGLMVKSRLRLNMRAYAAECGGIKGKPWVIYQLSPTTIAVTDAALAGANYPALTH